LSNGTLGQPSHLSFSVLKILIILNKQTRRQINPVYMIWESSFGRLIIPVTFP